MAIVIILAFLTSLDSVLGPAAAQRPNLSMQLGKISCPQMLCPAKKVNMSRHQIQEDGKSQPSPAPFPEDVRVFISRDVRIVETGNRSFTAEIQLEVEGFVGRDSDGVQLRSLKSRLRVELDVLRQKKIHLDNGFKPAKFTGYSQSFFL